jgi:hypothetical protein
MADIAETPIGAEPLLHLVRLSHQVGDQPDVWGVAIYAGQEGRGLAEATAADSGFEGVACVDDVARAALLGLRLHQVDGATVSLKIAQRWLAFVEYMQLPDGRFCNFIADWAGTYNLDGVTSVPGGSHWTARALWALGTAFQVTGEQRYQRAFQSGWRTRSAPATDIAAILLLAAISSLQRSPDSNLEADAQALADDILATQEDGYLVHRPGEREVHFWGYDQVTALVAASRHFDAPRYLAAAEATAQRLLRCQALAGPYRGYPSCDQESLCAYDVAACCRGLGALFAATGNADYAAWLERLFAWFDGDNAAGLPLYDRAEGRCHDGIDNNTLNPNCGAESAIEAGLVEVERRLLAAGRHLLPRRAWTLPVG